MADRGLLFYGYGRESAELVAGEYRKVLNAEIDIFGATAEDNPVVMDLLQNPEKGRFSEDAAKFIMFLGFDGDMIAAALKAYPQSLPRPIFCGMTENNSAWNVTYLMEHLIEEKNACR